MTNTLHLEIEAMNQPIDWRAYAAAQRGPVEPTFDLTDAVREGRALYVDAGGDASQIPRVEQLLQEAVTAGPATGEMLVRVPGRTGTGYTVRGRAGLRLFAKQVVDGQRLAALGPDPVDEVAKRLVLRGEDPAAARAAAAGLLWREPRDGSITYQPRASLPVDPNFNASGPPPIHGGDELIAMAASQLGTAMEADRRHRTLAAQGAAGEARLAAEQEAATAAEEARRAKTHTGPYPRF